MMVTPFLKRIKRHVTGRAHSFFAVTSPGLEDVCFRELMALPLSGKEAAVVKGGVEFDGRLFDCWLANLYLRTATRVLMRLDQFKASNFRQLSRHVSDFPWELFLFSDAGLNLRVSVKHSRLYHTEAICECLTAGIENRLSQTGMRRPENDRVLQEQTLFARVVDDRFTLSVDSSGANLYKRGIKTQGGIAPIRETIAAAVLTLGGYTGQEPLIDPMCGTGTFSIEGAMIAQRIPAGWFREFAFMQWPSFNPKRWSAMRGEARRQFIEISGALIFASDKDDQAVLNFSQITSQHPFCQIINSFCEDFFDMLPSEYTDTAGLVVINPPYGVRIGTRSQSGNLLDDICGKLQRDFKGWRVALITPEQFSSRNISFQHSSRPLYHGGLQLTLITGKISF
ncbi:MAG: hypothetical protein PHP23_05015 [Desulfobacterales bacterium]|nr:hypothetical protein [Desulfobacterales bacterium]MDD4073245.1 hypothetical protein [Desulfobacterales bacterium]MDD4391378.1 hypothetical protein [Desulfobacterales bacterium]